MISVWEEETAENWARLLDVPTVEFYDEIDSTNRRGREVAISGVATPAVIVAERQTAGQGRRGRRWISDTPDGLWCSVVMEAGPTPPLTPLVAGLAVLRAAEAQMALGPGPARLGIKWPNDVMASGKKVAGILCAHFGTRVVVGMGINVNHEKGALPTEVDCPATSLRLVAGRPLQRGTLLAGVVQELKSLVYGEGAVLTEALAELNQRSTVRRSALAVCGTVRHSSGTLEVVDEVRATGGRVLADGSLELLCPGGKSMILVAGSVKQTGGALTT